VLASFKLAPGFGPELGDDLFPAGRILANLTYLDFMFGWMEDRTLFKGCIVDHCPNLRCLSVMAYGGHVVSDVSASSWAASFATLSALTALTSLSLTALDVSLAPCVLSAMAGIPALRELSVEMMEADDLGSLMHLVGATQLTKLHVEALEFGEADEEGFNGIQLDCINKVCVCGEGGASRRLPVVAFVLEILTHLGKHIQGCGVAQACWG
jgi:hypothetical protein